MTSKPQWACLRYVDCLFTTMLRTDSHLYLSQMIADSAPKPIQVKVVEEEGRRYLQAVASIDKDPLEKLK